METSLRPKLETFSFELPINLQTSNLDLWSISWRSDGLWNMCVHKKHSLWDRFHCSELKIQKLLITCKKSSDFIFWSNSLESILMTSWVWRHDRIQLKSIDQMQVYRMPFICGSIGLVGRENNQLLKSSIYPVFCI